jgi:hypothetical protein
VGCGRFASDHRRRRLTVEFTDNAGGDRVVVVGERVEAGAR